MKRSIALLLITMLVLGALIFTGCGESSGGGSSFTFKTVGELKSSDTAYGFLKSDRRLAEDALVCVVGDGASGDITVPAKHDDKDVAAVIGESDTNDKVTSVTLEDGVMYIENCFSKSSAVKTLTLPAGFKGIFNSFNGSEIAELSCPSTCQYIVDSFCDCAKLTKAETTGYLYGINGSFLNDTALADVTIGGAVQKLSGSFNGCGVTEISFAGNIHDIIESFNECSALKSMKTEQIAGDISKSFCKCSALTDASFVQGLGSADKSFNDNDVLENVDFGTGAGNVADSFENCPKYTLPKAE